MRLLRIDKFDSVSGCAEGEDKKYRYIKIYVICEFRPALEAEKCVSLRNTFPRFADQTNCGSKNISEHKNREFIIFR